MNLTPEKLAEWGEIIFGKNWQGPLSEALNVRDDTMRKWLTRRDPIPAGIGKDLMRIVQTRARSMTNLFESHAAALAARPAGAPAQLEAGFYWAVVADHREPVELDVAGSVWVTGNDKPFTLDQVTLLERIQPPLAGGGFQTQVYSSMRRPGEDRKL
jgi:hypothetical protein